MNFYDIIYLPVLTKYLYIMKSKIHYTNKYLMLHLSKCFWLFNVFKFGLKYSNSCVNTCHSFGYNLIAPNKFMFI